MSKFTAMGNRLDYSHGGIIDLDEYNYSSITLNIECPFSESVYIRGTRKGIGKSIFVNIDCSDTQPSIHIDLDTMHHNRIKIINGNNLSILLNVHNTEVRLDKCRLEQFQINNLNNHVEFSNGTFILGCGGHPNVASKDISVSKVNFQFKNSTVFLPRNAHPFRGVYENCDIIGPELVQFRYGTIIDVVYFKNVGLFKYFLYPQILTLKQLEKILIGYDNPNAENVRIFTYMKQLFRLRPMSNI
ncbi:hypothetical protein [Pectinatus frisingensis]|uniref:hypothetical protein n=1 Tax=Pectinatus frisingensis TaxID=865 RepID=UPI0018C5F992|nr:hypothetical protein [Pectinatus frisingensis]